MSISSTGSESYIFSGLNRFYKNSISVGSKMGVFIYKAANGCVKTAAFVKKVFPKISSLFKTIFLSLPSSKLDRVVVRSIRWTAGVYFTLQMIAPYLAYKRYEYKGNGSLVSGYRYQCTIRGINQLFGIIKNPLQGLQSTQFLIMDLMKKTSSFEDLVKTPNLNFEKLHQVELYLKENPRLMINTLAEGRSPIYAALERDSDGHNFRGLIELMLRYAHKYGLTAEVEYHEKNGVPFKEALIKKYRDSKGYDNSLTEINRILFDYLIEKPGLTEREFDKAMSYCNDKVLLGLDSRKMPPFFKLLDLHSENQNSGYDNTIKALLLKMDKTDLYNRVLAHRYNGETFKSKLEESKIDLRRK